MTASDDLVVRLLGAIDEVEKVARDASGDWERQGPATGEHWQWVRSGHYDPLCDQSVDLDAEDPTDEFIADGNPVALRSVEHYPTTSVGPLPHFVVNGEGETARGPARHIVMHDPAAVLRLCQSHRDIVAMFPASAPHLDTEGSFYGFQSRDCGEHRTAGSHRAWCFDCSEWCYPKDPCRRCHGVSEVLRILARGYGLEEE